VEKMSQGHPLTDADRWGWLQRISEVSLETASLPTSPPEELADDTIHPPGCVTTCSALKKAYRDLLRDQLSRPGLAVLDFVFLTASEEVLLQRIQERQDHYMKSNMVHSQVVTAEVPRTEGNDDGDEEKELEPDCQVIWTDDLTPDEVVDKAIVVVRDMMINDVNAPTEDGDEGGIDVGT